MSTCPQQRLRLFLSVDLAGSTAFKAGKGAEQTKTDLYPEWVSVIRDFYIRFPAMVRQKFREICPSHPSEWLPPSLWKTIGDEILFCNRVFSREHLALSVDAFLKALEDYGEFLDNDGKYLDVKGAGWIAPFPTPNVTVKLAKADHEHTQIGNLKNKVDIKNEQVDESFEDMADKSPDKYDFLGQDIDAGFRVAKFASTEKFICSVELAWLLADAVHNKLMTGQFSYHDRQSLKGVLRDRPYPLVSIDTERSSLRREVQQRERALTGRSFVEAINLRDFLQSFMHESQIDIPYLCGKGENNTRETSFKYQRFEAAYQSVTLEMAKKAESEEQSAREAGVGNGVLEEDVTNSSLINSIAKKKIDCA